MLKYKENLCTNMTVYDCKVINLLQQAYKKIKPPGWMQHSGALRGRMDWMGTTNPYHVSIYSDFDL